MFETSCTPATRTLLGTKKMGMSVPTRAPGQIGTLLTLFIAVLAWRAIAFSLSNATLYVDEAQYWFWSQHLAWGYFSKPPGIAALIHLSTALFGDGPLGVKALTMLCYPLSALICWLIARHLYDASTAFWAAVAALTLPIYSWLGLFASTDAPLTLLWLLGLWFYLRAIEHGRWMDWLMLGAACGLGLLSKYTMAVFIAALFLHLLCFHRTFLTSAKPWAAAGLSLALLAPNLLWNLANDFPTLRHTADITLNRHSAGGLKSLAAFWGAQWISFGPLLGSVVALILFRFRQTWHDTPARLLLWFSLPLWAVVSVQALQGSANANWAAPAFGPMAILLVAWLRQRDQHKWLLAGFASNLALIGVIYHAPGLLAAANVSSQAKLNPFIRATGWDELGQQLRPLVQSHPDAVLIANNRTLLAHMAYELHDLQPRIASWNPEGVASDHFKLTMKLDAHRGGDALLLTEAAPGQEFTERFTHVEKLASLAAPLDTVTSRHIEVYLLHEFQGY